MIQRPTYISRIEPFIGKSIIKILIGVRRSGKSTLLRQIRERVLESGVPSERILSINFESGEFASISDEAALREYVSSRIPLQGRSALFLDEIQEVKGWERALRSFMVDYDMDIYVTGSNSQLLSSELATFITGRYVEIPVYPFSFAEFLDALVSRGQDADARSAFRKYVVQGGFPFQYELEFQNEPTRQYLEDVFNSILLKDVVQRNLIRDSGMLERIIDYVIEQVGHVLSPNNIASYLKGEGERVSVETVYSYLRASAEACLLYRAKREDTIGKKLLKSNEKFFVVDQGLRSARGFDNASAIDQVLENIVFLELKRRGFDITVGKVGEREIDFIARRGGQIEYYQVCYLLASRETIEREFGALQAVEDNYPKYVLSLDEFPQEREGVRGLNLIDWLLGVAQ